MLTIENLTAGYDGITALRGVSLDVTPGEMVALIGPNGAGKTTLLNSISGLVAHQGKVTFDGEDLSGTKAHRVSRMGLLHVPEGRRVMAEMSVAENLLLGGLTLSGRTPTHTLDDVYALFPRLLERKDQLSGTLSGGEQQMLAIGRALMGAPRMLLLDEPSLGLAPVIVTQVFRALKQLNADGMTILLVEQNARLALSVTHRAFVLERGRIATSGDSAAMAKDPEIISHYLSA